MKTNKSHCWKIARLPKHDFRYPSCLLEMKGISFADPDRFQVRIFPMFPDFRFVMSSTFNTNVLPRNYTHTAFWGGAPDRLQYFLEHFWIEQRCDQIWSLGPRIYHKNKLNNARNYGGILEIYHFSYLII